MQPVRAVLFDLHTTLVDGGDPAQWLAAAMATTGAAPAPDLEAAIAVLDTVWEHANRVDPQSDRDLSPSTHMAVFEQLLTTPDAGTGVVFPEVLVAELYRTMLTQWTPYRDAIPMLAALREAGIATALISNVGVDVSDLLIDTGLADHLDEVVLSYKEGIVKPNPAIFTAALERLGVPASQALMVGDSATADSGAVAAGIRTLLLPRTWSPVRGLNVVCRIVGVPEPELGAY